jgi:flagellar basal body rod protein FlgG
MESLDMLANNLANASAPGFKADREFYNTYVSTEAANGPDAGVESVMPVVERQFTDFSQGALTPTGNPLDVALRGKGFFVAMSPSGPLLTRAGSFQLSAAGDLQTQDGLPLRGQDGKPIHVDPTQQVEITSNGEIRQSGQMISQLDIVDTKDASRIGKHGLNYFDLPADLMASIEAPDLKQGALEAANVQPAESAVRIVSVMRQFEMLQRAANIGSDMGRKALEEVAKVSG